MTAVYGIALALGVIALVVVIMASAYATNVGRDHRDLNRRIGTRGRMTLAGILGFGMGGTAAEFSPLGFGSLVSLLLALTAAAAAVVWVHYRRADATS